MNDATRSASWGILNKPFKLKAFINETLTETDVTFSTPAIKSDYSKAALTARKLCDHLVKQNFDIKPLLLNILVVKHFI